MSLQLEHSNQVCLIPLRRVSVSPKVPLFLETIGEQALLINVRGIAYGSNRVISRDPEAYPNPDKFDPQRWLNNDGRVRDDLKYPSFGFGRR